MEGGTARGRCHYDGSEGKALVSNKLIGFVATKPSSYVAIFMQMILVPCGQRGVMFSTHVKRENVVQFQ